MTIDEKQAIFVLNQVIEHLKDREPKKTLTARKLIMEGLLELEMFITTVH